MGKDELNQYLGGEEGKKKRKEAWEKIEEQEKLQEIRRKKLKEKLEEMKEEQEEKLKKKDIEKAKKIFKKVDYVLKFVMTQEAYYYLETKRIQNPKLYKAIFRCVVDPRVIKNIDDYVHRCRTKGGPDEKITLKTILWYEEKLTGKKRETKIEVEEKGVRRSILE